MIKEIQDYLDQFELHKPQFALTPAVAGMGLSMTITAIGQAYPPNPGQDIIKRLVNNATHQLFDGYTKRWRINRQLVERETLSQINNLMFRFVVKNLKTPQPKQTKLFRWLVNNATNTPVQEGIYFLYKYVAVHCNGDMIYISDDTTHLKNTFLILEAMLERYP